MAATTPKHPDKLGAKKLTPQEQLKRFHDVVGSEAHGDVPKVKHTEPGAEKLAAEEQPRRFIEAAREAVADQNEADFDAALRRIAKPAAKTNS
ncbi:hypothetical protein [Methylobacterium sp. 285MFTsu5.1]|uniref:hypothetical protein n=1 Tax=Methylobacterium sp. 285MFTsu5.1 TaxID=1172187 RepID=UPI00037B9BA9|nr:hypothetical protein [Methylobacterium sp. 285MFTsu5.1]